MKKIITSARKSHIVYAEILIIGLLLIIFIIPFPTPKQYFGIFIINICCVLLLHPRSKTFVDFSLFSLLMLMLFISREQLYIAQKVGSFLFFLMINVIITELRFSHFRYLSPLAKNSKKFERLLVLAYDGVVDFLRSHSFIVALVLIFGILVLGGTIINEFGSLCLSLFRL